MNLHFGCRYLVKLLLIQPCAVELQNYTWENSITQLISKMWTGDAMPLKLQVHSISADHHCNQECVDCAVVLFYLVH